MSYGGYQQYGGNPYGSSGGGAYGSSNPYGSSSGGYGQDVEAGYGSSNPYGQSGQYSTGGGYTTTRPAPTQEQYSNQYSETSYNQTQDYAMDQPGTAPPPQNQSTIMGNQDFLSRVENVKTQIRSLTGNISEIGSIHQRVLASPDSGSNQQLESLVAQTQILNTSIKDQIKQLEVDAAKSGGNQTKDSQIRTLKSNFKSQLEEYQREEQTYRQRYRDQIARQYRIVNPEATDQEVREAADADWGDEGVFQTALKSNRAGAATSVLGAVRARHNDIQQIERTLIELNQLFQDLAEQVVLQEESVQQTEEATTRVKEDTKQGTKQLYRGVKNARRARKLKWWCFGIVVLIIVIIALAVGLYFGVGPGSNSSSNNDND